MIGSVATVAAMSLALQTAPAAVSTTVLLTTGAALALLSAEHAKRVVEARSHRRPTGWPYRVKVEPRRRSNVRMTIEIDCGCNAAALWERVSQLSAFLTIDPFHHKVVLTRNQPAAGVDVVLHHNAFGVRFLRFGRILKWREFTAETTAEKPQRGSFAMSDLSQRGAQAGFPHVFFVDVERRECGGSRLTIRVRGRWTSYVLPAPFAGLWMAYVGYDHARLLSKAL